MIFLPLCNCWIKILFSHVPQPSCCGFVKLLLIKQRMFPTLGKRRTSHGQNVDQIFYRVVEITTVLKICGFCRWVLQVLRIYTDYC